MKLTLVGLAGTAAAFRSAPSSRLARAPVSMSLAWDGNAQWLETCKADGVVSWFDAGLRLTDSSVSSP